MISASTTFWRSTAFWRSLGAAALAGMLLTVLTLFVWQSLLKAPNLRFEARAFQKVSGEAELIQAGLAISAPAENGQAMVMVPLPGVDAGDIQAITLKVRGLDRAVGSGLFWRVADDPSQARSAPLDLASVQQGEISTLGLPGWQGQLINVGLIVQGPFAEPVVVQQLGVVPTQVGLFDTLQRMVRNVAHLSDWDGGAVNFYIGAERQERRLTPTLLMLGWWFWSLVVFLALARFQPATEGQPDQSDGLKNVTVALAMLLMAWALLDLRWQADLWQRHLTPLTDPTLIDDQERQIALQALRDQVLTPSPESRVFLISAQPTEYRTYRTRYHLGAAPVSFGMNRLPTAAERQPGDIVVVLGSTDRLIFDRATGRLASSTESIPVTLLGNTPQTGGVFRIEESN